MYVNARSNLVSLLLWSNVTKRNIFFTRIVIRIVIGIVVLLLLTTDKYNYHHNNNNYYYYYAHSWTINLPHHPYPRRPYPHPHHSNDCMRITRQLGLGYPHPQPPHWTLIRRMMMMTTETTTPIAATPIRRRARMTRDIVECGRTLIQNRNRDTTSTSTTTTSTTTSNSDIRLVAFPTETVYGLGGYAFDRIALQQIFHVKERPTTDPLIVHVLHPKHAYPLWQATTTMTMTDPTASTTAVEAAILQSLCTTFWPGPLTIVARASDRVFPNHNDNDDSGVLSLLTAQTGYIAMRSPRHTIARAILQAAIDSYDDTDHPLPDSNHHQNHRTLGGGYIAAPSANKFGHVSPTTAQHVYDDLQYEPVLIYNDDIENNNEDVVVVDDDYAVDAGVHSVKDKSPPQCHKETESTLLSCDVGVESTVVKVECVMMNDDDGMNDTTTTTTTTMPSYHVTILRQGAISRNDIITALQTAGLMIKIPTSSFSTTTTSSLRPNVTTIPDSISSSSILSPFPLCYPNIIVTSNIQRRSNETESNVAPGQSIRHYSPNVPSYLVSTTCIEQYSSTKQRDNNNNRSSRRKDYDDYLSTAVIIDYGQQLMACQATALAYYDLSEQYQSNEAAQVVFRTLRWAETIPNATKILFPQYLSPPPNVDNDGNDIDDDDDDDALTLALQDRLTRAASGVVLQEFL